MQVSVVDHLCQQLPMKKTSIVGYGVALFQRNVGFDYQSLLKLEGMANGGAEKTNPVC